MGLPFNLFNQISQSLSQVELARRCKRYPLEISYHRIRGGGQSDEGFDITSKARQSCYDSVKVGMTKIDVARRFSKFMIEFDLDRPPLFTSARSP
jgi:hypothetical protein